MKNLDQIKSLIGEISATQFYGVLATSANNRPYTTLVAFALEDDLYRLFFATPRDTKKFSYLTANSSVSFHIHNSSNSTRDIGEAVGITITGRAYELSKEVYHKEVAHYLAKHPHLEEFTFGENTAFISIEVDRYDIVEHFQNVTVLSMKRRGKKL